MIEREPTAYFIGIGGVMMSALARLLAQRGWMVAGSDATDGPAVFRLRGAGIGVRVGHSPANLPAGLDLVVASAAIRPENVELSEARRRGLPVWDKGQLLRKLMSGHKAVCVAGTHGKTTTTAMAGLILLLHRVDPVVLVGGEVDYLDGNLRDGAGEHFVTETDESDGSFLNLTPDLAIVTNVERDHLDHWGTFERLVGGFGRFLRLVRPTGRAVVWAEDPHLPRLAAAGAAPLTLYGLGPDADVRATDLVLEPDRSLFALHAGGRRLGEVVLGVPGRHNVLNALAAVGMALHYGVAFEVVRAALGRFRGAKRRLERKGATAGVTVIDDYGHHPTEVRATLETLRRASPGRLICVFQPHRYSRTRQAYFEFGRSFDLADRLLLMDVYAAGEQPLPGVDSGLIYDSIDTRRRGAGGAERVGGHDEVVDKLAATVVPGDTVVTLGAGDVYKVGERLLSRLGLQVARLSVDATASAAPPLAPTPAPNSGSTAAGEAPEALLRAR